MRLISFLEFSNFIHEWTHDLLPGSTLSAAFIIKYGVDDVELENTPHPRPAARVILNRYVSD